MCKETRVFGFKDRRRKKIASRPFSEAWLVLLKKNVPLYARLSQADQEELKRHILVFMAEKRFEACGGLRMTDQIRITIAAHACILLLHRQTDYYPGLKTILVYPRAYVAANVHHFVGDTVLETEDVRLGESWHHGSVVLSWDDVRRSAGDVQDGQNVVFHEFAHQLDSSGGRGDSTPVLQDRSSFIAWARALGEDFEKFRRFVGANNHSGSPNATDGVGGPVPVLDEYGATDPAEFFAVATESFFERPQDLQQRYPRLYEELKRFYQQDPAVFGP
jgi:Mlc titration factor MtfA (ptsG expression regulator)